VCFIFALVAGVLSAAQKKAPGCTVSASDVLYPRRMYCIRVGAARALEAGTKLSLADVEGVQVHARAVLEGAFETVEDVAGLVITVQRLPGDRVTADMCDPKDRLATRRRTRWPRRSIPITVLWPSTSTRRRAWPGCSAPATPCRPSSSTSSIPRLSWSPQLVRGMLIARTSSGLRYVLYD
jgi:hypothetical protein